MVAVQRQPLLPEIVAAGDPPTRLPRTLHGRQQQSDERRDDRDHHEQFDERESLFFFPPLVE